MVLNAKKVIVPSHFLQLVDNVEAFNAFPQDAIMFEETHNSVKPSVEVMVVKKRGSQSNIYQYMLTKFPIIL